MTQQAKDERYIMLTWNERRLLERVLNEFPFHVLGRAVIYTGKTVESILAKLDEDAPQAVG